MLKTVVLLNIYVEAIIHFSILWLIESLKEQHLFKCIVLLLLLISLMHPRSISFKKSFSNPQTPQIYIFSMIQLWAMKIYSTIILLAS